jgi:hypothetical protein
MIKNLFSNRVFLYIFFTFIYYFMYKCFGFELIVIIGFGTIIGELTFIAKEKKL